MGFQRRNIRLRELHDRNRTILNQPRQLLWVERQGARIGGPATAALETGRRVVFGVGKAVFITVHAKGDRFDLIIAGHVILDVESVGGERVYALAVSGRCSRVGSKRKP